MKKLMSNVLKNKMILLLPLLAILSVISGTAQEPSYDARYDLTICTTERNASAVLYVANGSGNTFTGTLYIDEYVREVFGWYTAKISEGGGFIYNTQGMSFYVKLNENFQHQQLFKGLFNHDHTLISGTFFYWGNEFIFYGNRAEKEDNPVDTTPNAPNSLITIIIDNDISGLISISPNPADNSITIASTVVLLNNLYCELYSDNGVLIKRFDLYSNATQVDLSDIPAGNYLVKLFNSEGLVLGTVKIIKY